MNVNNAILVRQRNRFAICLIIFFLSFEISFFNSLAFSEESALTSSPEIAAKQQIFDTTFWWSPWYSGSEKKDVTVRFYFGGRFIGFNEDGFKKVIENVKKLPSGTSIVWGPDCGKMLNGPGEDVVARDYFPQLWKDFKETSDKQGVILSSSGYGSIAESADDPPKLPEFHYIEPKAPKQNNEVILDWKFPDNEKNSPHDEMNGRLWPVYSLDGRESGHGPEGFLATLKEIAQIPQGTQLRFLSGEPPGMKTFRSEFRELVALKQVKLAVELEKTRWPGNANRTIGCRFEWRNFKSQTTPHKDVVYLIDGKLAGMGDAGFDAVLANLRALPAGSLVEYPKFVLHALVRHDSKLERFESKDVVPFNKRRQEMNELLEKSHFEIERDEVLYWPKPVYDDHVDESLETEWFLDSLFSFATIIRDGANPSDAQAIITWSQKRDEWRRPTTEGKYYYNEEKIGTGAKGFLDVLKCIESLPDGSTIRLDPVCIRTHGPFNDAIIMRGQRHFETTGEEPFRGMIDLLKDIAQRKKLRIEVIPDEGKPYHHRGG